MLEVVAQLATQEYNRCDAHADNDARGQETVCSIDWSRAAAFQEEVVTTDIILSVIGVVLALPGGLFVAGFSSMARAKWAALFGGLIGGVVVAGVILFWVNATNMGIDGLSYFFGVFFAASVGVMLGALVVNFLVGLVSRSSSESAIER
jgi:hypothetical protein